MSIIPTSLIEYTSPAALSATAAVLILLCVLAVRTLTLRQGLPNADHRPARLSMDGEPTDHPPDVEANTAREANEEITSVVVQEGDDVFVVSSLTEMPKDAVRLPMGSQVIRSVARMTARAAAAALSIPGRRIELVYKPEVAKALQEGSAALMQTKNSEVLTDVVDVLTGKILGKARIQQGGQLAQAGAMGFQIVSMLVAQQHMDDIKKMFESLQESVDSIKDMLEADAKAEIVGTLNHLKKIHSLMASGEMNVEAASLHLNYIQNVIAKTAIWQERIFIDVANVTEKVSNVKSNEWFGTGDTHSRMVSHIKQAQSPMERWRTLVELCSLLNFHSEMLGGIERGYVGADPDFDRMGRLASEMSSVTHAKTKSLIDGHFFNTQSTLDQRRKSLMNDGFRVDTVNLEAKALFVSRSSKTKSLRDGMNMEQRFIIDLDQDGNYTDAYVVSPIVNDGSIPLTGRQGG